MPHPLSPLALLMLYLVDKLSTYLYKVKSCTKNIFYSDDSPLLTKQFYISVCSCFTNVLIPLNRLIVFTDATNSLIWC